ncbi:MAG: nucleotide exchange factor GrpE [Bdellovibrionota bacterium]
MSDQNPKVEIEIDPSLMDEAVDAISDSKSKERTKESKLSEDQKEKIQTEPNADEYRDRWIRVTADFDNFRKRVQKEKADMIKYGNENLIKELLPVLDNFERAMAAPNSGNDSFAQGVQMIYQQLLMMLERFGVTSESAKGKIFDPNLHEAMSYKEDSSVEPHTVLEEHQKMYFLNKKLIRPALVTVSKGDGAPDSNDDEPSEEGN